MPRITFSRSRPTLGADGLGQLAAAWRGLQDAAGASAFQRWDWVGCLAAERYPDLLIVQAHRGQDLLGMALLNRRAGRLWLQESGDPALDSVFVEWNGPLVLPGADQSAVVSGLLRCALADPSGRWGGVTLSGVDAAVLEAARMSGGVASHQPRASPFVDLRAIPDGTDYLDTLSRNTRQQLRRSTRAYGPARLERAATAAQALEFLDALATLHTATWERRGNPGAFAQPAFLRFHRELVARGVPSGTVDLLRVSAGPGVVGYLYNLRAAGRVCAYQGGFDYQGAPAHGKPGLLCHHAAIERARATGDVAYDFLGGGGRYKESLANARATLHWLRLLPRWHPRALISALTGR